MFAFLQTNELTVGYAGCRIRVVRRAPPSDAPRCSMAIADHRSDGLMLDQPLADTECMAPGGAQLVRGCALRNGAYTKWLVATSGADHRNILGSATPGV